METLGYIVVGKWGAKSYDDSWVPEGCKKGIAVNGKPVAIHPTRARAKGAMERTKKMAKQLGQENNPAWNVSRTERVVSAGSSS